MEQMYLLLLVQVLVIQIFSLVVEEEVPNLIQLMLHPQEATVVEALAEEQQPLMVVEAELQEVMLQLILVVVEEEMVMQIALL